MARSLTRLSPLCNLSSATATATATRMISFRHSSNNPDVEKPGEEVEKVAMKNLEDAIHKIIVKRSQPDWIPLVPGASYWVPPKSKAHGLAKVIGKLAFDSNTGMMMMKDKGFGIDSHRGWPSSADFFKGASHSPLEGEITSKHTSQSEDEEG